VSIGRTPIAKRHMDVLERLSSGRLGGNDCGARPKSAAQWEAMLAGFTFGDAFRGGYAV